MATSLNNHLGDRIREARRSAGFRNIEQLAVRMDIGQRTLQRWETGESEPTVSRLREIAALTDRPLSFFLSGEVAA